MDNMSWILKYDPKKALPYLQKKQLLLGNMQSGDQGLRCQAIIMIDQALHQMTSS
jgi:hypothetical protein